MEAPSLSTDINSPLTLTPEDVDRLLHDTSSDTRIDMTDRIAGAYGKEKLQGSEVMIAEQVFRLLLRDTELRVRISLAENVKSSDAIPRDIILSLAKDVEEVSLPVLECSDVLTDEDLVKLIEASTGSSRHLAISKRKSVSEKVSDSLLDRGDGAVVVSLAGNQGAVLSESGVDKVISRHGGDDAVMESLAHCSNLPPSAVNKIVAVVSSSLADTLKKKYAVSATQIEQEIEKTRETQTLEILRHIHDSSETKKIIGQLRVYNGLTSSIILGALCQGNVLFFEYSLASLAEVPLENAHKLISDKGGLGFRALYNKSGLPNNMFPAVSALLSVVHELHGQGQETGTIQFANRVIEHLLQRSESENIENISTIIALVRKAAQIESK